jgi:hypothetical protein
MIKDDNSNYFATKIERNYNFSEIVVYFTDSFKIKTEWNTAPVFIIYICRMSINVTQSDGKNDFGTI